MTPRELLAWAAAGAFSVILAAVAVLVVFAAVQAIRGKARR